MRTGHPPISNASGEYPAARVSEVQNTRITLHAMNLPKASGNLLTYDAGLQTGERPTEKKKVRRKASDLSQNRRRRTPMKKKKKKLSPTT